MSQATGSEDFDTVLEQVTGTQMERGEIAALLGELGQRVGLNGLTLGTDGTAVLTLDDELEIWLSHQPGFAGITVTAPLPDDPAGRPALLRQLLQSNMDWGTTGGGTFCLLPATGLLALCRRIALADRDLDRIGTELAAFVELAGTWMREISLYADLFEDTDDRAAAGLLPGAPVPGAIRA
ncbi:MAG: type III secretion system chaperone [Sulfitobacter sp.]|nr:type III secretion system chaperone [Sulfitobacter sp.]